MSYSWNIPKDTKMFTERTLILLNFSILPGTKTMGAIYWFRYECSDFIRACWWSGTPIQDCCADTETVMTDYGKCIRIHNRAQRRQWLSGFDHGWEILVDVKNFERVGIIMTSSKRIV